MIRSTKKKKEKKRINFFQYCLCKYFVLHSLNFVFNFVLFDSIPSWMTDFSLYKVAEDKHRKVKDNDCRNESQTILSKENTEM